MRRKVWLVIIALSLLISPVMGADKYSIDGDITDWGVDLSTGLCDTTTCYDDSHKTGIISAWIPSESTVDWVVEDDIYGEYTSGCWDEHSRTCTCYAYGVHITGTGSTYSNYVEPKLDYTCTGCGSDKIAEPSGGEKYDIEAIYFDDDENNLYFAIVVSSTEELGDLYLKIAGVEYGVVLTSHDKYSKGYIIINPEWRDDNYKESGSNCYWDGLQRTTIKPGGTMVGEAEVKDEDTGILDHEFTNYVIEVKIPRQAVGSPPMGSGDVSFSLSCGNENIGKTVEYDYNTIPEFTTIAIPVMMLMGALYLFRRK